MVESGSGLVPLSFHQHYLVVSRSCCTRGRMNVEKGLFVRKDLIGCSSAFRSIERWEVRAFPRNFAGPVQDVILLSELVGFFVLKGC